MEFCTRLANQLMLKKVEEHEEKNSVVSPVSINAVLNMVVAGSKGATLDHFFALLGSKTVNEINSESAKMMAVAADVGLNSANKGTEDNDDIGLVLAMVNGAWFDQRFPLKPSYGEDILKGIFNCEAKTVHFATHANQVRDEINAWAEAASRGLIKDFLEPDSPSSEAALVLINGLYFKGNWNCDYKFNSELTKNRDFNLMNGDIVSVPFMTSCACYPCQSFDGFKVLSIPYESGQLSSRDFSMYFFLPDERDGLQNLLKKLMILKPRNYFNLYHNELDQFWIPKFKFSYGFDVLKSMRDMGTPFSFLTNPKELSEMMHVPEDVNDFVPNMIQKAFIEIDEKGTEAAAITEFSDEMGCSLEEPERMSFVADHPFVFMIREATSGLVFFHWSSA
ncbi:serpin-ZX-like [Rhododendron vialii]|uniref:serpin-ZX-like n=1 Tax=Rhododendron vialii TaxID=182163 RepID=UPI00265EFE1E|nr:serpin-ZX-like [Rhododendron vialii]